MKYLKSLLLGFLLLFAWPMSLEITPDFQGRVSLEAQDLSPPLTIVLDADTELSVLSVQTLSDFNYLVESVLPAQVSLPSIWASTPPGRTLTWKSPQLGCIGNFSLEPAHNWNPRREMG